MEEQQKSETGPPGVKEQPPAEAQRGAREEHRKISVESREKLTINELAGMNMRELRRMASGMGVNHETLISMKKQEIIFSILKMHTERGGQIYAQGALEILPDGYGFLRSPNYSYLPGPDDIYISPSQIRLFNLKTGYGVRSDPPSERRRAFLRHAAGRERELRCSRSGSEPYSLREPYAPISG